MDYKEKYNKLVEAVKVLQEENPSDESIQNWVNDNVPELRESEDEKTRKEIVGYLKKNLRYEWATWLEKQGKKPAWSEEDEEMYQNIHECLKNGWKKLPTDLLKCESWFKYLKQRIGGKV